MTIAFRTSGKVLPVLRARVSGLLLLLLLAATSYNKVYATHAAGAELTYRCLGGMQYELVATFYRDCGGTPEPNSITITYKSASCSYSRMVIAGKAPAPNGDEITMPCAASPSSCDGGISTGLRKWIYKAVITLPFACTDWMFSYRICCRNCTITTIQNPCASGSELYVESLLNNVDAPCNSSPTYNNDPVAFVCLGQNFNYNQGAADIDGDSLTYELITPKVSESNEITWASPNSTQSPLISSTPFLIDQATGDLNFTPSAMQIGIIAVRILEYRNGNLIGSTIRDMQVYTRNCFNSIPSLTGIDSTNNFTVTACKGNNLCFRIYSADPDSGQTLSFEYNNLPPGAVINASPDYRPYLDFCWMPDSSYLGPGSISFTITVRDDACPMNDIQTYSYTIKVGGPAVTVTATPPSCTGQNTGSATVVNSGSGTVVWDTNPVQYGNTANNLPPGTYNVIVTDNVGCSDTVQATVPAPPNPMNIIANGSGNITCNSGNVATGNVVINGGNQPYSYYWSNGQTTQSVSGLGAGIYTITVTDASGCTATDTIAVNQEANNLSAATIVTDSIKCYGDSSGGLSIVCSNGVQPYTYQWSNGSTVQNITGLSAGNYSVIITDANGCSVTESIELVQPGSSLTSQLNSITNVGCYGDSTGSLSVQAAGGTAPYTYNWSNGGQGNSIYDLVSGNYSVVIYDANGCSVSVTEQITQPSQPIQVISDSISTVTCGNDNGNIFISVTGAVLPAIYSWSNGQSGVNATNLPAGSYSVTVTDANGCSAGGNFIVPGDTTTISINTVVVDSVSCKGGTNGTASIIVNSNNLPVTYLWSTGASTQTVSGLMAGIYTVTATDSEGCQSTANVMVPEPELPLNVTGNITNADCSGGIKGSVNIIVTGGEGPYIYLWNNGNTSAQISGLDPGIYLLTITDRLGCTVQESFEISAAGLPAVNVGGGDTICSGETVTLFADSLPDANYQWYFNGNVLNGANANTFITPAGGNYFVTVETGCGNVVSDTLKVIVKSIDNISVSNQQIICPPETATLFAAGGAKYKWTPETYITFTNVPDPVVSPPTTTVYNVEISNEFGCSAILSTTVAVVCDSLLVPTGFSPNGDGTNDGYVIEGIENYPGNKLWVYNRWGKLVYKATDYMNSWDGVSNISGVYKSKKVPAGTYYYILDLNNRSKPRSGYLIIRH